MNELELIIREEIRALGPMRFDRYMELALYHPRRGYYEGERCIGRGGDFFTSVSVGPLFGQLLARQAWQAWRLLGQPRLFWIIEQGAHDARLAIDILEECRVVEPKFFEAVQYGVIERSLAARELQKLRVAEANLAGKVRWMETLDEAAREKPAGIYICNELVDAFPVRVVRHASGEWRERHVDVKENGLGWTDLSITDEELQRAIHQLELPKIEGYVTEINLVARNWMHEMAGVLDRGYALVIDYGFPASVYYAPFRVGGTLTAYRQHKRSDDLLLEPGGRDITAHVDFTALAQAAKAAGLTPLGLVDQQRFLMGVAQDELSGAVKYPRGISEQSRAWNTLTHPEHLGVRFQVLVLAKDAPADLDGLRFARPGGLD